ncbi:hypothetical protein FACS189487_10610 [Campylobacterota bacterium]|nr:hypothetical protein FACS189487_10610 [Campylobacterota bacterium]
MGKILNAVFWIFFCASSLCAQKIVSHDLSSDRLVIVFDQKLAEKDYKTFEIKAEKGAPFRQVIDISSHFPANSFEDRFTATARVKIAQFSPYTTRIVFSDENSFDINITISEKTMIVAIKSEAKSVQKTIDRFNGYKPIVMIDAGHGGRDTGAIGIGNTAEKEIVLKIAIAAAKSLKELGYDARMTRDKDKYVSLQNRTGEANKIKADLFVSIHANACPPPKKLDGIETYFLSPANSERAKEVAALENGVVENMERYSKETFLNFLNRELVVSSNKLAIDIQRSMLYYARESFSGVSDGGVREGPFWVLVGAQMPAVLIEVGYITHKEEIKRVTNESYQQAIADGIALGIDSYFLNNLAKRQ